MSAEPPEDGRLWILDATTKRLAPARQFLEGDPSRQIIVFGACDGDWEHLPALIVEDPADLNEVRKTVREALSGSTGETP